MKKLLFTFFLSILSISIYSQNTLLSIDNWSDSTVFRWSHPTVRGYGQFSDSLANAIPGKAEFYEYQETYYSVNSWADYYYWFTNAYWYRFKRPVGEYEVFYLLGDNFMMVDWLNSQYGSLFPNGLMQPEDPFSRQLSNFYALVDKQSIMTESNRRRQNSISAEGKANYDALTNRPGLFGAFSGNSSGSGSSGSGRSVSSGNGGSSNVGPSIGN